MPYEDPNIGPNRSSGKKFAFGAVLVVLALLFYAMAKDIEKLPSAKPSPGIPATSETHAAPAEMREVAVGFRVGGRVDQMFFAEHAEVKKGDILASLDKTPLEQALASAKAQLQLAQAEYNKSSHLTNGTFNAIEAARANVETSQHAYDVASAELAQRRGMITAGVVDNVYDDDVQNERDARLDLARKRRELAQQEDSANVNTNRDADKASVEAAQAEVAIAETNLADAQLLAPADGTIASRAAEPGVIVQVGAPVYVLSVPRVDAANPQ